ncbi:dihydrolipoamide acetyltransferase family protein [Parafrigoribacterium humi]|uniref:dihydrolipoamide acetyltransferase family protein n=1 Tax=Parafrigoribacterium humi TaxID=3144664 RepID=UPI0032EB9B38
MSEVIMPRLSDTMEEGELAKWLKNIGDPVKKGESLAEIETDKATMDLEAFEDGVLEQQLVAEGTIVPIGQPVAVIGDGSGASASAPAAPAAGASAPAHATEAPAPTPEAPAAEPAASAALPVAETPAPVQHVVAPDDKLRASPLARKIARDNGIDLADIAGSGPQGRVVRADVDAAIAGGTPKSTAAPAAPAAAPLAVGAEDEEVAVSKIRLVAARRLTGSQAVPHFFLTSVVDVERLLSFRKEVNAGLESQGVKVSVNDLLVRAAALALRLHPDANSSWAGDKLLRHGHVNVGIAVATPTGLLVPVVADADRKSLSEIAVETVSLAGKARDGKLKLNEMSGGTFSISNLGMFGIDQFTAVINPPEAAILAVGAASPVPVLRDGALMEVPKLKITLTVDHRVMDGAVAAAFLRELVDILEQPLRIVI